MTKMRNKKYKRLRCFMRSQGVEFTDRYTTYNQTKKRIDVIINAKIGANVFVANGRDDLDAMRKFYKLWRDSARMQKKMAEMVKKEDRYMRYLEKSK